MQEQGPSRRLRFVPALDPVDLPSPRGQETAESILPGTPRVAALDALLRDVDELRLTLETDLTLAAAAVEAGSPSAAADIITGDLDCLQAFERSAMGHLAELASWPATPVASRWGGLARLSGAPFVAAAAVVALLLGVVPQVVGSSGAPSGISSVSAQSSLDHLANLARQGRTSEVRVTAMTLHDQISALVDSGNPASAQEALRLLSKERSLILQSGDGVALHDVLLQSAALAARIRSELPSTLRKATRPPALITVLQPDPKRESPRARTSSSPSPVAAPKATASPTPSPKPSPTASPTASPTPSPTTSASPTASSSPSSGTPFLPAGSGEPTPSASRR